MRRTINHFRAVGCTVTKGIHHEVVLLYLFICYVWSKSLVENLKPVFNDTPVNVTFYRGETATLPCSVSNRGSSSVVWKKSDQLNPLTVGEFTFVSDPHFSVKHIPFRDEWNLIIDHVEMKHAGKYECQVSTKDDYFIRVIELTVIDEVHHDSKYVFIDGPRLVEKGHPIRLTCNASGYKRTPTDISWYLGGLPLYNGMTPHIKIITYPRSDVYTLFSELRITKSSTDNSGTYICQAEFYSDVLKVAKHRLSITNSDSNQIKRGTLYDGSVYPPGKKESTNKNSSGSIFSKDKCCIVKILFSIVAWHLICGFIQT